MNTYATSSTQDRREGRVARAIEKQTSKLPSDVFLWAAGASVLGSLALQLIQPKPAGVFHFFPSRRGQMSLFVGQWAPTLLLLGIYNKIVKVAGSDKSGATG